MVSVDGKFPDVCPWDVLIIASDQPDILPSSAYFKHVYFGIGSLVHTDADLQFTSPSGLSSRLCVFGRHMKSRVDPGLWGLITPSTYIYICPERHSIEIHHIHPSSTQFPSFPDIDHRYLHAVVDCSQFPVDRRQFSPSSPVYRCESRSLSCAGLNHSRFGRIPNLVPLSGSDRLERLISSLSLSDSSPAPSWAQPIRSVFLHSPPGNGKFQRIRELSLQSGLFHIDISFASVLSHRFLSYKDAFLFEMSTASSLGGVVSFSDLPAVFPPAVDLSGDLRPLMLAMCSVIANPPANLLVIAPSSSLIHPEILTRFHDRIQLGLPSSTDSVIHLIHDQLGSPIAPDVNLARVAIMMQAHTIADIIAICNRARAHCPQSTITASAFDAAIGSVPPLALADSAVSIPNTHWDDIGGLAQTKQRLREFVQLPLENADAFARLGIHPIKGCLLYGPPGTGKTMLAKAVATESCCNFVSVSISDLIKCEVGASEAYLRGVFVKAKSAAPCVVFFDEFQAMFGVRETGTSSTLLVQLLSEMDSSPANVFILAATNRPDMIDQGLLRPGRFDRVLLVPPPDLVGRLAIIRRLRSKVAIDGRIDEQALAESTDGFTGADLMSLVQKAGLCALGRDINAVTIEERDIASAREAGCSPSVTQHIMDELENWRRRFKPKN